MVCERTEKNAEMLRGTSILLTDLYQLTMLQGYFDQKMEATAVFEFFVNCRQAAGF